MIDELSKELDQTDPYYVNRLLTKGVIRDISCKPLRELEKVLLLCSEISLRLSSDFSLQYFTTSTFRRSCSSRIKITRFAEELNETFWTTEDKLFLKIFGKCLKYWEFRDVLFVHHPKTLFLFLLVNKTLMKLNRCLCNILANQLFLELNQ